MVRFVAQCILAGLAILAALVIVLAWWPFPSEFQHECKRIGGSFVAGTDGAADLCIGSISGERGV